MRKFTSYGAVDPQIHYHAPRTQLIEQTCQKLVGDNPEQGGHYITIWAPRQTGKTWLLQQVVQRFRHLDEFEVVIMTMQSGKFVDSPAELLNILVSYLRSRLDLDDLPEITDWLQLPDFFTSDNFEKPLILILDEFDALTDEFINAFANQFRTIYIQRQNESDKSSYEKTYILHGLALIGVRSVLGIENVSGSPFNIQRSVHVPNLTLAEVTAMFHDYSEESGQAVVPRVVQRLYDETRGQPGLVGWFGELLTETYNRHEDAITEEDFEIVYSAGLNLLPNNNVLNIISKANKEPYRETVLNLFNTNQKIPFRYDNRNLNYLYLNGVIEPQQDDPITYMTRFASPFVQKRLFHYFVDEFVPPLNQLYDPFDDMSDTITDTAIFIPRLVQRHEHYLHQHRDWLLKDVPRRSSDDRITEAVYHFNLYTYLMHFLVDYGGRVFPEFPTGNGKIDLIIDYADQTYGIEVKSFVNRKQYNQALGQAAHYGKQLSLSDIWLVFFVEVVSDENRQLYEKAHVDDETQVTVHPIFLVTGG